MMIESIKKYALENPDRAALVNGQRKLNYKEFYEEIIKTAQNIAKHKIAHNERVAVISNNNFDFVVTLAALWMTGVAPALINPNLLPCEICDVLKGLDFRVVFLHKDLQQINSKIKNFKSISFPLAQSFEKSEINFLQCEKIKSTDPAVLISTSGSSGTPKFTAINFKSLYTSAESANALFNFSDNCLWLASLPFYHIGGFSILTRSFIFGSTIIIPESLKIESLVESLSKSSPTHISLTPSVLKKLIDLKVKFPSSIKYAFIGGGPSDTSIIKKAIENKLPIVKVYGSTETCAMVAAMSANETIRRLGASGRPIGGNEIKIVKVKDSDKDGEIWIKSPSLALGVFDNTGFNSLELKNEFFNTGDYGYIDGEGYLFITMRRTDLIISGGININPYEIEAHIKNIPAVDEACVIGLPDIEWGEICAAVVSLKKNKELTPENIIHYLKGKIASYKIPKKIFFLKELPITDLGKIKRGELKKIFTFKST